MSISSPQNRIEFRQYILTNLGAPVIEINIADEQIDIAIDDAFQWFNERSHFLGTERMYLTTRMTPQFLEAFGSFDLQETSQQGKRSPEVPIPGRPTTSAPGMVAELTLVSPGSGYPENYQVQTNISTTTQKDIDITTQGSLDIQTDSGGNIVYQTSGEGNGTGLTVTIGSQRTTSNGITNVTIYATGSNYSVGDIVSINASSTQTEALFEVTKVQTESPLFGNTPITSQNNYLVMPDDVVGVNSVLTAHATDMVGIFPGGAVFPLMLGGMLGNDFSCGDQGYNLVSYVAMREYMATLEFLFFPPIQYNFNERTHRLFVDSNDFQNKSGHLLCLECMVKPSPEVYPDLYNDLWLKEYAVALVKAQWGRNLTKYNQVNLPGGITMNGAQILADARDDIKNLKDRFSMDWMDPPLDLVG